MNYINKQTGARITSSEYNRLSSYDRSRYMESSSSSSSSNGDLGLSMVVGMATDSAILGTVVGGSLLGGILGDMMDGDLMD